MKNFLLLLLLLPFLGNSQITLPVIPDLVVCDDVDSNGQDGLRAIDIISHISPFLIDYQLPNYKTEVYVTLMGAESGVFSMITIPNHYAATNEQTLYIRVENTATEEFAVAQFNVIINTPAILNSPTLLALCEGALPNDTVTIFDLTQKNLEIIGSNCTECTVEYYEQDPKATPTALPIVDPSVYTNTVNPMTIWVRVTNANGCKSYTSLTIKVLSKPVINNTNTIYSCTNTFNLTENRAQGESQYTITYHTSLSDAETMQNPIPNPQSYVSATAGSVWISALLDSGNLEEPMCQTIREQKIESVNQTINLGGGTVCYNFTTGQAEAPYVIGPDFNSVNYSFSWYKNGLLIPSATSQYYEAEETGTYSLIAEHNVTGCEVTWQTEVIVSGPATPMGQGYFVNGQTVSLFVLGFGEYNFSIDDQPHQASNVFMNVSYGTHSFLVTDINGCGILTIEMFMPVPNAPTGESNQNFTEGGTLADLVVNGDNILWYDNDGTIPSPPDGDGEPLPLTTLLVNGKTYYASQTVNDIESTSRFAVTAHLVLDNESHIFKGLNYYPNPVNDVLNISSNDFIESVTVTNMLGQAVITKEIKASSAALDLSGLSNGIYLIKLSSAGKTRALKIIKE